MCQETGDCPYNGVFTATRPTPPPTTSMELIRGQHNLRPRHRGCVATIGNFDGVHLGHRLILDQLADQAVQLRLPRLVITFEPQPQEFFAGPNAPPARLMRLREKLLALEDLGIERVLCLEFDHRLAAMPAEAFIDDLLVARLGVRHLVIGDDFRFGHRRAGNFDLLVEAGQRHGFTVADSHSHSLDGERVSSTRIRQALARAIWNWRRDCWAGLTTCAGGSRTATVAGAPSAFRPPTSTCIAGSRRFPAFMPCWSAILPTLARYRQRRPAPRWRASASDWKCIYSIFRAICTAGTSGRFSALSPPGTTLRIADRPASADPAGRASRSRLFRRTGPPLHPQLPPTTGSRGVSHALPKGRGAFSHRFLEAYRG